MLNSFEYKGYRLVETDEVEPRENRKIFHDVTTPTGEKIIMPHTPYENVTEKSFRRWIDTGMPKAPRGNWTNRELEG